MAPSRTASRTRPTNTLLSPSHMEHIAISDDDVAADMDEPPESTLQFARKSVNATPVPVNHAAQNQFMATRMCRSPSLLTRGLLTSPELHPIAIDTTMARAHSTASSGSMASLGSTADLTSDGGLTSPARTSTPSPPLPPYTMHTGLALIPSKSLDGFHDDELVNPTPVQSHREPTESETPTPVAPAPRKRCITFACTQPKKAASTEATQEASTKATQAEDAPRKTCLRFACPTKPARTQEEQAPSLSIRSRPLSPAPSKMISRLHRDSQSTIKEPSEDHVETPKPKEKAKLDVLRTHEFGAPKNDEESWIKEGPSSRHKITVSDTLRKENAIRKLGEEAEQEALEDEEDEDEENEFEDELDELDSDEDQDGYNSDDELDGNETDDEEGFADSDDESDDGSDYQFWTPAITTAATSMEQLEHIRSRPHRSASESSIEASINTNGVPISPPMQPAKKSKEKRHRHLTPMRPGTPELPDSTDFVCGTFDEDRPLEAAYLSCMEQRRIAKKGVLPQDLDPSFPNSDPEQDDDDDDDMVEDDEDDEDDPSWVAGQLDDIDETPARGRARSNSHRQPRKSPAHSPLKRNKSPAPIAMKRQNSHRAPSPAPAAIKRQNSHRALSPAPAAMQRQNSRRTTEIPRRLFNRSPAPRMPPPTRHLPSPPASREGSVSGEVAPNRLAQRPNLTRTKSLPRTPNPFFLRSQHRQRQAAARAVVSTEGSDQEDDDTRSDTAGTAGDEPPMHSRGPIDIVQGLEQKRQRRKDKFWRQHGRNAARDREREARRQRACPGKGAERMRDIGLEMADRTRGYGQQRLPLVLSV